MIIARLKEKGVTTVAFAGHPFHPIFLTNEASAQNYFPEWMITGSALTDTTCGTDELGNDAVGLYRYVDGGKRYLPSLWPKGEPKAFVEEGSVVMYMERPAQDFPRTTNTHTCTTEGPRSSQHSGEVGSAPGPKPPDTSDWGT